VNREALRVTARNGCIQPVRGNYGAIRLPSCSRPRAAIRPRSIALVLLLAGMGIFAYFLVSQALEPRPSLRILSPAPNSVVLGGRVTISVEVENARLSTGTGAAEGRHLHYYLDAIVPTAHDKPAVPTSGSWTSTTKTAHEWSISGEGLHILAVQLVGKDDRPLNPPVVAAVVVHAPQPAATPPASPQPTSPVK
jgi:hypothetical protein